MNITNKSGKIICVGDVTILPGETEPISADFANNPVLKTLAFKGMIEVGGKVDSGDDAKPLSATEIRKFNKAKLVEMATELDLEDFDYDTNAVLADKIIAAMNVE